MTWKPPSTSPSFCPQIHIPKLGIHGRLEPRNLDDDGLPDDLQLLKALQAALGCVSSGCCLNTKSWDGGRGRVDRYITSAKLVKLTPITMVCDTEGPYNL